MYNNHVLCELLKGDDSVVSTAFGRAKDGRHGGVESFEAESLGISSEILRC